MYKIVVISDLHIGTKDGADDFAIDEATIRIDGGNYEVSTR